MGKSGKLKKPLKPNEVLVLRDVHPDMTSRNGFCWPKSGRVEAPDWRDDDVCGRGLHGLPWGVGGEYLIGGPKAKWLVVRVCTDPGNYRHGSGDMTDKCKFREGEVVFCGNREDAVALILQHCPPGSRVNWATQTAGDCSTQTAGDWSTQTAGDDSTQTAGYHSTQTAGWRSTQTAGDCSTQKAGGWSTQTAGDCSTQKAGGCSTQTAGWRSTQTAGGWSTQRAGHHSTQTSGNFSTQTAGDCSTQKAGGWSTQTASDCSTQNAGNCSTQTAGDDCYFRAGVGSVQITRWYDIDLQICRTAARMVTEAEANKWYHTLQGVWREATGDEVAEIESGK